MNHINMNLSSNLLNYKDIPCVENQGICKRSCNYPNCKNKWYSGSTCNKHFFKFPKDQLRHLKWRRLCGIPENVNSTHFRLCEDHFTENSFSSTLHTRLLRGAIPTETKRVNNEIHIETIDDGDNSESDIENYSFDSAALSLGDTLELSATKYSKISSDSNLRMTDKYFNEESNSSDSSIEIIIRKSGVSEKELNIYSDHVSENLKLEKTLLSGNIQYDNNSISIQSSHFKENKLKIYSDSPPNQHKDENSKITIKESPTNKIVSSVNSLGGYMCKCNYPGCTNKRINGAKDNKHFFKFPRDQLRHSKWKQLCGISEHVNSKNFRLCQDHFSENSFSSTFCHKLLKFALPSKPFHKDCVSEKYILEIYDY